MGLLLHVSYSALCHVGAQIIFFVKLLYVNIHAWSSLSRTTIMKLYIFYFIPFYLINIKKCSLLFSSLKSWVIQLDSLWQVLFAGSTHILFKYAVLSRWRRFGDCTSSFNVSSAIFITLPFSQLHDISFQGFCLLGALSFICQWDLIFAPFFVVGIYL